MENMENKDLEMNNESMENEEMNMDQQDEDVIILENAKEKKIFGRTYYYVPKAKKERKPVNKKKVAIIAASIIGGVALAAGTVAVVMAKKDRGDTDDGMTELPVQDAAKVIESLADKMETIGVANDLIDQAKTEGTEVKEF